MSELYELPDGWDWKKLGDTRVCKLVMGQSPNSNSYNKDGLGMPFFQGKKEFGDLYPTVEQYTTEPNKIAEIGDILLSVRAPVGPTNIANIQCCIGRGLGAIRPNESKTLTNYLLYFFRNFELEISSKGKGSTFSAITKKELEDTDIPLPPLPEQKRIVSKLDNLFEKIDKSIALHQKNMDEADAFMGSVLNDVFGELEERYGSYKLDEICKFSQGIQVPTNEQLEEYEEGLYKFIRIINYTQLSDEYRYIKNYSEKANVNEDDIVMVRYGATAGFIGKGQNGIIANNLFRVIPNSDYINDFIYYGIQNPKNQSAMYNNIGAAAMPAVNFGTMSLLTIPNISVVIQQKVVTYLDEISEKTEKVKAIQKEKMESLKALKASILDRAFRGEL